MAKLYNTGMEAERINSLQSHLNLLRTRVADLRGIFDFDSKSQRLIEVNLQLEDPKVWDDPKQAQALGKEKDA